MFVYVCVTPQVMKKGSLRESMFAAETEAEEVMEGFLLKKGDNLLTPWQTRFFTLRGHYLKYYNDESVARKKDYCLGAIDISLVEVLGNY